MAAIDDLVPRLSPAQILVDLHRDISEQSVAFRHFNADLSTKLRQGFSEGMGPTLERMVTTTEDLSRILRATEAQKQDSIIGSLQELLRNLERSITASFEGMSSKFTETLFGSAQQEFDRVINSLGGTARLLEGMNAQFQTTQSALHDLVIFAKSSTAEQMALGKSQVEELTAVLHGLMVQINETAGSSVSQMAATLTAVVHDLSTKVTELGQQMTSTMMESAGKATSAADAVIEKADSWSSRSAEQLAQLFERYQGHLDRVENIRDTLDTTLARLMETLGQYTKLTADLRDISTQMNAIAASVAGTAKSMENTCDAVQGVASLTASQVERLAEANHRQEETCRATLKNKLKEFVVGGVEVNSDPKDPLGLLVIVPEGLLQFAFNEDKISLEGIDFMKDFTPKLVSAVCSRENKGKINSIVVEGHTDSLGKDAYNLLLSQRRSMAVVQESLSVLSNSDERSCFLEFISASDRGSAELVTNPDKTVCMPCSRRVVFRIRVRSIEQRQLREVLGYTASSQISSPP